MSKSITREQVNAINVKMSNGFQLDVCALAFYGEKKAVKSIKLDDDTLMTLFNDKQRDGEMIRVPKRLAEPVA